MSFIQSQIRCDNCQHQMNVAFGIIGMIQIAGWPSKCPQCSWTAFTKVADRWEYKTVNAARTEPYEGEEMTPAAPGVPQEPTP